jgi:hypothetical protein
MQQNSDREFERLPLCVDRVLAGVPLHDVWAVDLPSCMRSNRGLEKDQEMTKVLKYNRKSISEPPEKASCRERWLFMPEKRESSHLGSKGGSIPPR